MGESFKEVAARFLNCRSGVLPFKYLGLPIGANLKSLSTRNPVIDSLSKRLSSWKWRHLSLGSRITMINVVLKVF